MAESTPHQTPATDTTLPTAPDLLARRGWFATAAAFGAALLTKFGWPERAEAVNPPLLLNQDNPATARTSLSGAVSDILLEIDQPDGTKGALSILGGNSTTFAANALDVTGAAVSAATGPSVTGGTAIAGIGGGANPGSVVPVNGGTGVLGVGSGGALGGTPGDGVVGLGVLGGGNGVTGFTFSTASAGVLGRNNGSGAGVRAENQLGAGVGLLAVSQLSHGMFGNSAAPGAFGGIGLGVGFGLGGVSQTGIGLAGINVNGANWAGAFFGANQNAPGLYVTGAFVVQGPKSGAVETAHHGTRLLYAIESPESWFEDFGTARLEAGQAVVPLEAIFRETVRSEHRYRVFLTPRGDCEGLYVAAQDGHGFEVRELRGGRSSVEFDYRVVVKARGHEARRLEPIEPPARPPIPEPPSFEATSRPEIIDRLGGLRDRGHRAAIRS